MRLWSCHCPLFESNRYLTWLSSTWLVPLAKIQTECRNTTWICHCWLSKKSTFLGPWQSYYILTHSRPGDFIGPRSVKKNSGAILCFHLTPQTQEASRSLICLRPTHPPRLHWPVSIWSRVYRRRDRCHPSRHHPWTAGRLLDCRWPELKVRRTLGDLTLSISFICSPVIG